MVGEAVEQGRGHLGVAEHRWPFAEGEVGGDDDRGALVEPAHEVEQQLAAGLGEGQMAEFVEDDEVAPGELVGGAALASGAVLGVEIVDRVIVYDPWWNPAVERQAMDRAHRIGQDKPVFVHRRIAENTVEAAIQRMQARKQALTDALFEGTGRGTLGLTDEDIDALFGPGRPG